MNYWQFKFKEDYWYDWEDATVGHIENWKYPRLNKDKDIAVGDIVCIYRTDKQKGIYFVAKIINIDLSRDENPIDIEIIKDLKESYFKPEENGFLDLLKKVNKLGQNGAIYKFSKNDNPEDLFRKLMEDEDIKLPEEIKEDGIYEGAKKQITVNIYERDSKARQLCIEKYGYSCFVCNFDFEKNYGEVGKNFIHVHHLKPLSEIRETYKVNPIEDLRPVCPNCHAMLHKRNPAYTINELKDILSQ